MDQTNHDGKRSLAPGMLLYSIFPLYFVVTQTLMAKFSNIPFTWQAFVTTVPWLPMTWLMIRAFFLLPLWNCFLELKEESCCWDKVIQTCQLTVLLFTLFLFFSYTFLTDTFHVSIDSGNNVKMAAIVIWFNVELAHLILVVFDEGARLLSMTAWLYFSSGLLAVMLVPRVKTLAPAYTLILVGGCVLCWLVFFLSCKKEGLPGDQVSLPRLIMSGTAAALEQAVFCISAVFVILPVIENLEDGDGYLLVLPVFLLILNIPSNLIATCVQKQGFNSRYMLFIYLIWVGQIVFGIFVMYQIPNLFEFLGISNHNIHNTVQLTIISFSLFFPVFLLVRIFSSYFIHVGEIGYSLIATTVTFLGYFSIVYMLKIVFQPVFTVKDFGLIVGSGFSIYFVCQMCLYLSLVKRLKQQN